MPGPPPPECGAPTRRQASPTQPTAGPRPRELARRPLGAPLIKSLGRPRSRPRSALALASEPAPGSDSEDDNRHPVHRKSYYDADTEERAHTARPGGVFSSRNLLFLSAFYGALPDGPRKSDRATRRAGWCRELDVCQNRQTSVSSASCQTSLSRPQRVQPAANPGGRSGSVEIKSNSLKTE